MRRFIAGGGYVRVRAITGALFAVFGIAIVVQGVGIVAHQLGSWYKAIPVFAMGIALVVLGVLRIRDFMQARKLA